MDLRMYPYGNAHEKKLPNGHYAYECQHGGRECQGNFIEACIQRATNFKASFYYPVLECMKAAKDPLNAAQECLENFVPNAKWDDVSKCANVRSVAFGKRDSSSKMANNPIGFSNIVIHF